MNYCKSKNWKFNISFTYALSSANCPLCSDCSSPLLLRPESHFSCSASDLILYSFGLASHTLDSMLNFALNSQETALICISATSSALLSPILSWINFTFNTSSPVEVIIFYATAASLLFICKCIHNIFRKPDPQS